MKLMQSTDTVIVVGGGVFGCAVAYYLAKRGIAVTVIERDDFAAHASSNNPGNLNPIHGAPPALLPLSLKSFAMHDDLAIELGGLGCQAYELQPVRRVLLAFNEQDQSYLHESAQAFAGMDGFSTSPLARETLLQLDERVSKEAQAGLLIKGNKSVNSGLFHRALADGAARLGAKFVRDQVIDVRRDGSTIVGVQLQHGSLACDQIVFASGPWVAQAREWLGFELRVKPVKGEMLRIALPGAPLQYDFTFGMTSLYRRGTDECWIGVTREDAGLDETPSEEGRRQLLQAASRIMPTVADAQVLAHTAALRPMAPDNLPQVGPVPGWENCYVANGGGIKGMLLCTGVGAAIADLITDGITTIPISIPK